MSRNDPRLDDLLRQTFTSPSGEAGEVPYLAQFRKIARAMALPSYAAPAEVVARAQAVFARAAPLRARILGGTLWAAGARRSAADEDFQIAFEHDGVRIRILYAKSGDGWEMVGRISKPQTEVLSGEERLEVGDDGSFRMVARRLEDTGLILSTEGGQVEIPTAAEALEHGPDLGD